MQLNSNEDSRHLSPSRKRNNSGWGALRAGSPIEAEQTRTTVYNHRFAKGAITARIGAEYREGQGVWRVRHFVEATDDSR
jgi:hypothetical protein